MLCITTNYISQFSSAMAGNASSAADEINSRFMTSFAEASQERTVKRISSPFASLVMDRSTQTVVHARILLDDGGLASA